MPHKDALESIGNRVKLRYNNARIDGEGSQGSINSHEQRLLKCVKMDWNDNMHEMPNPGWVKRAWKSGTEGQRACREPGLFHCSALSLGQPSKDTAALARKPGKATAPPGPANVF
eukprot:1157198-Pelagomonas_calceolata.AAC.5